MDFKFDKLLGLAGNDLKNLLRDSMLRLMFFAPILIILIVRMLIPEVTTLLHNRLSFNLAAYYPLIVSFFLILPSMMFGTALGFIFLEERDEGILQYISVTPITATGYMLYRLITFSLLSFIGTLLLIVFNGLLSYNLAPALLIILLVSLETPIYAIILASLASNKVEGLAVAKITGLLLVGPVLGFFLRSPWKYIGAIFPPFWVTEGFLAGLSNLRDCFLYIISGFIIHLIIIMLLLHLFQKKLTN
ncbi:MAG TPA: ABC transporter permease [Bacillota bacterium]|nr:ABC transporter permease [Bacillota bacterium]HOL09513.1 ABC transporter permease [Bacillota bacterium]HPO98702.1 ABC transporter permease [Bacillota bacterium]